MTWFLTCALVIGLLLVLRHRRINRLRSRIVGDKIRTGWGDSAPAAQAIWDARFLGAVDQADRARIRDARDCSELEQILRNATPDEERCESLLVADARAGQVAAATDLVSRATAVGSGALDAVLSSFGSNLDAGAFVMGAWQAHQILDFVRDHSELVDRAADGITNAAGELGFAAVEHHAEALLGGGLPIFTIARVSWEQVHLVQQGKAVEVALGHAALDIAGRAGGALIGAKAGAMAGSVLPGVGHLVGIVGGAVLGSWAGGGAANAIKRRPLTAALRDLETAVGDCVPGGHDASWEHLSAVICAPYESSAEVAESWSEPVPRSFWRWLRPRYGDLACELSMAVAGAATAEREQQMNAVHAEFDVVSSGTGLGASLVLLNCPAEAAEFDIPAEKLEAVRRAQQHAVAVRQDLFGASH